MRSMADPSQQKAAHRDVDHGFGYVYALLVVAQPGVAIV